jgi:hypothetical protein
MILKLHTSLIVMSFQNHCKQGVLQAIFHGLLLLYSTLQNTRETAQAVKKMPLGRAKRYLKNVVEKREIVPFRRFNGGVGRHAQVCDLKSVERFEVCVIF